MNGAEYIARVLKEEKVTKVFGQCGHTNYALIDALHKAGIEFISFRHEQMAAHAADAYYRVSHQLAVVLVHLSPGLTNALTGVVSAAADCTPMLVLAGNTPSYHHPREAHQCIRFHADASQGDIFRPVCKRVWRVDDPDHLPDVMARALNLAHSGRPVIFAGGGVVLSEAWEEVQALAEHLGIPVATTLMGKGVIPEDHPLALGTTGIWGTRLANETTKNADVVLAVGTAFGEADCSSWHPGYTFAIPPTRLIQIDIDPHEIGKIYPVEVGIAGDAKAVLLSFPEETQRIEPL